MLMSCLSGSTRRVTLLSLFLSSHFPKTTHSLCRYTSPSVQVLILGFDYKKSTLVPTAYSASSLAPVILTQDKLKKIVAYKAVDDEARRGSNRLAFAPGGSVLTMPVELVQYGWKYVHQKLQDLFVDVSCVAKLITKGESGEPFETYNKNDIVDLYLKKYIRDLKVASNSTLRIVGVVEHWMFLDVATTVIVTRELGVTVKNK
ncbi:hypothetical protein UlMin_040652 [Ulmus minor]